MRTVTFARTLSLTLLALLLLIPTATHADSQVYSSAGSNTWVVPTGVTSITVKVWGAGGGGGGNGGSGVSGGAGGGGGYATAVLLVAPGQSLTVDVGGGGGAASAGCLANSGGGSAGAGATGPGAAGGNPGPTGCSGPGGGGGGGSFVLRGPTLLVAAGGGGGGGGTESGGGPGAGGGGGVNGANGGGSSAGGTTGGSGTSAGTAGGHPGGDASAGGGGGGGKLGGTGGGYPNADAVGGAGGGGGSNYGDSTTNGSGTTPGNNGDSDYASPAGIGGAAQAAGNAGRIIISYTVSGLFSHTAIVLTGNVRFSGNLAITGALSKGSGTFAIDDPLDPGNKILFHSFVESPDVKNIYDGIATLDENGEVVVKLPDYFDALNKDVRYQFFALNQAMPNLYIKEEEKNNQFTLGGGAAGGRISWQVTGIRHDPYILAHPIIVEVWKGAGQPVNAGSCIFESLCK